LSEELARWRPREVLFAAETSLFRQARPEEVAAATLTPLEPWIFEAGFARGVLESHFGVLSLEGFGLSARPWAAAAAGAIVHYVKETQRSQLAHVDRLGYYERQHGLVLDAVTARNLELVEPLFASAELATLRAALDATVTPMGKRLLRQWLLRPSTEIEEIRGRHGPWPGWWPTGRDGRSCAPPRAACRIWSGCWGGWRLKPPCRGTCWPWRRH